MTTAQLTLSRRLPDSPERPPETAMVRLDSVVKRYGSFEAVRGLDLDVPRGEIFGFLGLNGAGKTTTIRMVAGILQPTSGQVVIGGHDMASNPEEAKSRIGYIPDRPYLYEKLSGGEFLRFVAGRDATQWSQLILLGVLVVVYVYNIRVLPLYSGEELSFFLLNLISFLNLGLAGFVIAAIAARFVFPAMSLEGRMLWLLGSSPMDIRRLFWVKYWVGAVPLLAVAMPLIVVTNIILEVSPFIMTLSTVTMAAATLTMTALALGFGAVYPNFETENAAEIPTSLGGLLFMMAAVGYLAVVILLEAWPVYTYLRGRAAGSSLGDGMLPLVVGLSGAALATVVATVLPLRAGVRRIRELEV